MDQAAKEQELGHLTQVRRIQVIENTTASAFVCVHSSESLRDGFHCYSYLLPLDNKEAFLSYVAWHLRNDDFTPRVQYEESYLDGECQRRVFYLQRGNESGAEALVRRRFYWKNYPPEIEIADEFRLFWNLFHDKTRGVFLHSDANGTEHTVARVAGSRVEIQLKYLVDFLRAKQMHLALQWEGNYWSKYALAELGVAAAQHENVGDLFRWWFSMNEKTALDDFKTISRLLGKAIIPCPGEVTYDNPYAGDDTTHPTFIVGTDATGREITDAWDEAAGQDNALTPVFFRRAVLGKYFAEPERYEVGDGDLRCSGFWSLRMDNDHPQHVVAWLKDLGQGLPSAEREHWRSYNIAPDGVPPSRTFYIRNVRAWFADPTLPDLRAKTLYPLVNEDWSKRHGWLLWRDLAPEDRYIFRQLHVCLDENQAEFDQQNGLLAKLMVDSLNVAEITNELKVDKPPDGSLNRLEVFLTAAGFANAKQQIEPLRVIQNLRSAGAAHAKGEPYAAAITRGGLEGLSLVDASMTVFQGAVNFLQWVRTSVLEVEETGPPPLTC